MSHASEQSSRSVAEEFLDLAIDLLTRSAFELFETYGCTIERGSRSPEAKVHLDLTLGAAIGFTGEYVRGILAIAVDDELAKRLNPVLPDPDSCGGDDWIGELANQLLGRLKNKLLRFNIEVAITTPIIVHGSHLKIGTVHRKATRLAFSSGASQADVWLDAEVDPALAISEEDAPDVQAEGAMVLF